jgi:hypothetical protein
MGLWNPTLRKVREEWGTLFRGGVGLQQVPHRAFSPVRNDKLYYHYRLVARLKSWPSRAWRFLNPQRDGVWNPTLRKVREEWGTLVRGGADRQQVRRLRKIIRLADDLSPLGMTRF